MKKWNHYVCDKCMKTSIHRHDADGVTPFMYHCQATAGCDGTAKSRLFRGPQSDDQTADVIWWKPTAEELEIELEKYGGHLKNSVRRHVEQGGLLSRDVNPQYVPGTRH